MRKFLSYKLSLKGRFYYHKRTWFKIIKAELLFIKLHWDLDGIRWGDGREYQIIKKVKATPAEVRKIMECDRWTFSTKYCSC